MHLTITLLNVVGNSIILVMQRWQKAAFEFECLQRAGHQHSTKGNTGILKANANY